MSASRFDRAMDRAVPSFFWAVGVTIGHYWKSAELVPVVWGSFIVYALGAVYFWRKP